MECERIFNKKIVKKKGKKKPCEKKILVKNCPTSWKIGFWEKKNPNHEKKPLKWSKSLRLETLKQYSFFETKGILLMGRPQKINSRGVKEEGEIELLKKKKKSPCADLNEIGIGICRGGKNPGFPPPPWTPYDFAKISPRCMKIFLDNLECICWSGRPKFLANLHSGQNYKRLKKKLLKMMGFVLPHMIRPIMAGKSWIKFFCVFLI